MFCVCFSYTGKNNSGLTCLVLVMGFKAVIYTRFVSGLLCATAH